MKRRRIVAAAIVLAAVAAGWFFMGRGTESFVVGPGVTLITNLERNNLVITPGTPLQIEVSLSSARGAPAMSIGGWWRSWHAYVHLEDPATGKAAPWPLKLIDSTSAVLESDADSMSLNATTRRVAYLEQGRQVHTVTFFVAPTDTAQTRPGIYQLRAAVETPLWQIWGWRGRAVSSPMTITVKARDDGQADIEVLETRRLHYAAKYYLSVGQTTEARESVEQLESVDADNPATRILLGDVFAADGETDRALAEYHRAIALLPRSYEEPTLLMERIRRLDKSTTLTGTQ